MHVKGTSQQREHSFEAGFHSQRYLPRDQMDRAVKHKDLRLIVCWMSILASQLYEKLAAFPSACVRQLNNPLLFVD